jgi:hypothetical protein
MLVVPPACWAGLGWTAAVNNNTLPAKAQGTYLQNSAATRCQHGKGAFAVATNAGVLVAVACTLSDHVWLWQCVLGLTSQRSSQAEASLLQLHVLFSLCDMGNSLICHI